MTGVVLLYELIFRPQANIAMKRFLFASVIGVYTLVAFSAAAREPVSVDPAVADPSSIVCTIDCWVTDETEDTALLVSSSLSSPVQPFSYARPAVVVTAGFHSIDRPHARGPPANLPMS